MRNLTRRDAVKLSIAGVIPATGCIGFGSNQIGGDALRLSNETAEPMTITLKVSKISDDNDLAHERWRGSRSSNQPTPTQSPIWDREDVFDVPAMEVHVKHDYIDEAGSFYVVGDVTDGPTGGGWYWLSTGVDGPTGPVLWIEATSFEVTVEVVHEE